MYNVYVRASWFVSLCTCIMCMFVYHGVIAIMEAGQNVCVSLCICIMCMFVYHGVIAIMEVGQNVCESVYMYRVYVCVSWCHSH